MANIHVQNWRDERGTDLEKAQAFVNDRNNKLTKVSEKLGIPVRTLKEYRAHPEKLRVASWERVATLARFHDANYIMDNMTVEDTKGFMNYLNDMFKEVAGKMSEEDTHVISKMRHIIMDDPLAVVELFDAYRDQLDDSDNWF